MSALLIIGAGGHGKVVADAALETGRWDEVIFLDDSWPEKQKNGRWIIHGKVNQILEWKDRCVNAIVAIGNNQLRMHLQTRLHLVGFEVPTIVHPTARVSRYAKLGTGCVVLANAVVNVDAEVANAGIINTAATVDHDCRLGDGVHISPGANLGGGVTVGDFSWIGIGAAVRQYQSIGSSVTVGAGAVVVTNLEDGITVIGNPARPMNS
jgi:sugar O-acyltransferase (sialic acid O-acetyltransferase NeuD family)